MKRFLNIEYCKATALLLVLIYHYWTLVGNWSIPISGLNTIISLGGEIGVTMFFILSGFGINCLLASREVPSWREFVKRRLIRIAPLYYFSILIIIAFTTSGAWYLSKQGIPHLVLHILFLHNLHHAYSGSINGSLWTMGVIIQYYLISIWLYKCLQKNKYVTLILSIVVTIVSKMIIFKYIDVNYGEQGNGLYFVYGRGILTALDNFVIGMFIAQIAKSRKKTLSNIMGVIIGIILIICLISWGNLGLTCGIYKNYFLGYTWHTGLAILLGAIICTLSLVRENPKLKLLGKIGKSEYGIYLIHFPILQNLLNAPMFQYLNSNNLQLVGLLIYLLIACGIGIVFNQCIKISTKRNNS